ncbi:MAG: lipoyl synthase [Candidatus Krumholzibacteriota bacterium]|nr:lipoyl synthase [Candidatus Krumholzibacteriota bacterium]
MASFTGSRRSERLPSWLRRPIPVIGQCSRIETVIRRHKLHTICREGLCPNRAECYSKGKVTFMILGDVCTRGCRFCSVRKGRPAPVEAGEPAALAEAARTLGLRHVIVTSVTRDDLPDGGAGHYAAVVRALRALDPAPVVEVLVPDFEGSRTSLETVLEAGPRILSHNMETVRRLYPAMRRGADYDRSLSLLAEVKRIDKEVFTKSSFMLGLGETEEELFGAMTDLRGADVDFTALGQYLRPGMEQEPVREYVHPERFARIERESYRMGFLEVTAGPLVRSSYQENDTGAAVSARTDVTPDVRRRIDS